MRPFTFRLANVLTIWQRREDAALAILLRQQAATGAARTRALDAEAACVAAAAEAVAAVATPDVMGDPGWHRNWILYLSAERDRARQDVTRCVALEVTSRTAWQQARRDRRVLERLRERAQRRFQAGARRDEMKQMDELAGRGAMFKEGLRW